jgi:adenine-specific DNA-methyltransferase
MAKLDDLIAQVGDANLRSHLEEAVGELRRRKKFGLVFEQHIPETTVLPDAEVRKGSVVLIRTEPANRTRYVVDAVDGTEATISSGDESWTISTGDLLVVKPFGEPVYPVLRAVGQPVARGGDKPFQTVINGENFHALQLLVFGCSGNVDCIYVDPPYNTGARDWKYNNDFVDRQDAWRHSKWLSFMDKRLRLAQRLLKPNGVLIVTIDENEVSHLGVLLEQLFPEARRQMVTICINPSGASGQGLSRVDEYAWFCFFGESEPVATPDDMLSPIVESDGATVEWESLLRRGNAWYRESRRNLCYPVVVDPASHRIVDVGPPLEGDDDDRPHERDGLSLAWPVRTDGRLGIWRVDGARLRILAESGYAYVSSWDESRGTWTIRYLMSGTINDIEAGSIAVTGTGEYGQVLLEKTGPREATAKTMWHRGRHTAGGSGGTQILNAFLGERNLFPFPKSVYAVRDCLAVAVGDRKDALIVDFFAGSGTTLHAACLLNAEDGGRRRTILVTNNEVDEKRAAALNKAGLYLGDPEFEAHGIFEQVTRPRCEASITGRRHDGAPVPGKYISGRAYSDGFDESLLSFDVRYADPDSIDVGTGFEDIMPALWFAAGCYDDPMKIAHDDRWSISPSARFAVLLDEDHFRQFRWALAEHSEITHVWLVTDSEAAFARMRDGIGGSRQVGMLYRDYLRNFRVNVDPSLAQGDRP